MSDPAVVDGRRVRGDASRKVVLSSATNLASIDGLDGLTIGHLAEASGHSKSSIATLFRSKEGLQLATIAAAKEIFIARIVEPARSEPRGVRRLATLMRNNLDYSRERVFDGGCFFLATSADVDSKPGPVRDAVRTMLKEWYSYIEAQVGHAVAAGELTVDVAETEEIAFLLIALEEHANSRSLLIDDERPYAVAAAAMVGRLLAAGAHPEMLTALTSD